MYAVRWDYYGSDSTRNHVLASYGTKFAADNWMHKSNGIQLGLTDSIRCQLPENTDGTGYWKITVYAMGYADYEIPFEAAADNIVKDEEAEIDTFALQNAIAQAEALKEYEYTSESWAAMQTELQEAKEEIAAPHTQAVVDEAVSHLTQAISDLKKVNPEISLNKTTAALYTGQTITLTASVKGLDAAAITYASDNDKVASVDSQTGVVTAKKAGTAAITAACGEYKATCKVTVKASSLKLSKTSATLYTDKTKNTLTLKSTLTGVSGTVTYTSSNTKVATVNAKGAVTAKKAGTATITAACGSCKATCKITVKTSSLKLNKKTATVYKKNTLSLKAAKTGVTGTVTYKSSNTKVATVNAKGVVTAKKAGTATITAACSGCKAACKVTVKNLTLKLSKNSAKIKVGKTVKIKATAVPSKKITYKSNNTKIATVTAKGVVKGKKAGKTTITVSCNGVSKKFVVTVKK